MQCKIQGQPTWDTKLMKIHIILIALIVGQMTCFAQDNPVTKEKRIWGATHFRTVMGDNKDRTLELDDISQGPEHLIGSGTLIRRKKESPELVIQGHLNKIGEFTPNVSLAVSDRENGNWKIIESPFADKVDVTLTGASHIDQLFIRIQLDAFQPYIGKFRFCRVTLQAGESDVFPMAWLTEKGE
jgi:hypothetical protein